MNLMMETTTTVARATWRSNDVSFRDASLMAANFGDAELSVSLSFGDLFVMMSKEELMGHLETTLLDGWSKISEAVLFGTCCSFVR